MSDLMFLLIPGAPLLAALWIAFRVITGWRRRGECECNTSNAALLGAGISFSLLLVADAFYLFKVGTRTIQFFPWLHSGDYQTSFSFLFDGLSLTTATVMSLIGLIVTKFSVNYLHREEGFQRFFIVLCLFLTAMQLIVLSGSALMAFVGWELAGVSSYLLIAYNWRSVIATQNATRAFVTNRVGDAGFLLGLFMGFTWFHSTEWNALLAPNSLVPSLMVGITALGFMGAALVKSAQFPFSAWITRALEGPTPSSTVFYGSVMVHVGIFLLLRVYPLISQAPALQYLLILIGIMTIAFGWLGGWAQADIKTSLLFSTLAQTGLMLIEIGFGWTSLALIHMLLHMVWRAYQFLFSPSFALFVDWGKAPTVPAWIRKSTWLQAATLQRFWLEPITDWLLVKPTKALSQEAQVFDDHILDKLSGTPTRHTGISSLAEMQALQQGSLRLESGIGVGSGILGKLMQWSAEQLEWLEQRLLLQQGGNKDKSPLTIIGRYLDRIDHLLTQPRYLVLLVAVTLVVIF